MAWLRVASINWVVPYEAVRFVRSTLRVLVAWAKWRYGN
jgi:hypothetical protein